MTFTQPLPAGPAEKEKDGLIMRVAELEAALAAKEKQLEEQQRESAPPTSSRGSTPPRAGSTDSGGLPCSPVDQAWRTLCATERAPVNQRTDLEAKLVHEMQVSCEFVLP